jgi:hypothetical protein
MNLLFLVFFCALPSNVQASRLITLISNGEVSSTKKLLVPTGNYDGYNPKASSCFDFSCENFKSTPFRTALSDFQHHKLENDVNEIDLCKIENKTNNDLSIQIQLSGNNFFTADNSSIRINHNKFN